MRVLSPVGERAAVEVKAAKKARVTGEVVGIVDDGLSGVFMPHLVDSLKQKAEPAQVIYVKKSNGGAPAPQDAIDRLAQECQAVIVGVAL